MNTTIHPNDQMFLECGRSESHYYGVGRSVMKCLRAAMLLTPDPPNVDVILDFGCNYGRVLRYLASQYPHATLHAADVNEEAVKFCAETFNAIPHLSRSDFSALHWPIGANIIYAGSVATHLTWLSFIDMLKFFDRTIAPRGIVMFTTHGRFPMWTIEEGTSDYGMPEREANAAVMMARQTGWGWGKYSKTLPEHRYGAKDWGCSFAKMDTVIAGIAMPHWRLIMASERGVDNHQDVFAYQSNPPVDLTDA